MTVLAAFSYPKGARYAPQRQQTPAFAIGWQPDAIALASGQYTVLKEFSFGGYELHIRFHEWVWDWDNRTIHLDDLFADYYAIPPGGGAPVSAGTVYIDWTIDPGFVVPLLVIVNPAPADHYYFQRFPAATRSYWCPPHDELPSTPFWYPA